MPKRPKLKTPEWILQGYDSEEDYLNATGKEKKKEGSVFKIRECPNCGSDDVGVVVSGNFDDDKNSEEDCEDDETFIKSKPKGMWECRKCKWKGTDVLEKELNEEELMEYMDKKEMEGN